MPGEFVIYNKQQTACPIRMGGFLSCGKAVRMYVQVKAVPSELLCPSSSHPERMSGRDEERFHPERLYCYRGLRDTKKLPAVAQGIFISRHGHSVKECGNNLLLSE